MTNYLKKYSFPSPFVFSFSPRYFIEHHKCKLNASDTYINLSHNNFVLLQWNMKLKVLSSDTFSLYVHCFFEKGKYECIPLQFRVEQDSPYIFPNESLFDFNLQKVNYRIGWYINFKDYKNVYALFQKNMKCVYAVSYCKKIENMYPESILNNLPRPSSPLFSNSMNDHFVPGMWTTMGMPSIKDVMCNYRPYRQKSRAHFVLPSLRQFYYSDPTHSIQYTIPENVFMNLATYKLTLYVDQYKDVFQCMLFTDTHLMVNKLSQSSNKFVNPYKHGQMILYKCDKNGEYIIWTLLSSNDENNITKGKSWFYKAHEPLTLVHFCQPEFMHAQIKGLLPHMTYRCVLECCLVNDKNEYVTQYETCFDL